MSACVEAYDSCHLECVPETTVPEAPPAPAPPVNTQPLEPYDPNTSTNTKHQDVTEETQVGTPDLETEDQEDPYPTEEEMENTNQEVQETETEEVTEEEDGFIEIPAPPGGEDDEEFNDDPSDY
ncbi:hypothetical protein BGZ99_002965 [Dissophora globulifera]|uniref:Uncharacterized protein n=1 Tax=Dissophora globulifera TaxID=979702 RepID=A0A9P6QXG5_9FUNG|nr:hypothetical protein BGZ99_002965 [Dissophora globulifera]